jgi:hypothetical protein
MDEDDDDDQRRRRRGKSESDSLEAGMTICHNLGPGGSVSLSLMLLATSLLVYWRFGYHILVRYPF